MKTISHIVTSIKRRFAMYFHRLKFGNAVFFSIGENCLADNILARNKLKSFSTPYSSGRSNIEYVLSFEKDNFSDLLNAQYLQQQFVDGKNVVRNNKYLATTNRYNPICVNGLEFTHHDVINDKASIKRIKKRCKRQLSLHNKKITMLYHHRYCENTDEQLMMEHLQQLKNIYVNRGNKVRIFVFSQVLVSSKNERKVVMEKSSNDKDIYFYKFYTLHLWEGKDENVFWARCDDDLLLAMIKDIKQAK